MVQAHFKNAQSQNSKNNLEVNLKENLPRGRRWEEFEGNEELGEDGNRWRDRVAVWLM
jgi:hypothetical protein